MVGMVQDPSPSGSGGQSQTAGGGFSSSVDPWADYSADPNLQTPPRGGLAGNQPAGEDLDLSIGWDRFEKLVLALTHGVLGLRGIRFRRYGVHGQAQHGIDLAGRKPDGGYAVVQCKNYQVFTAADLRKAVETFAKGRRPFDARELIIATSASTQGTQVADELGKLQDEHPELDLELWGSEQINEFLRYRADIVARFWTRETADSFCTGAPVPGVPAPPLDRQQQAERILLGPLQTPDVVPLLREADAKLSDDPAASAQLYSDLAARLDEPRFRAHALTLRHRQLDALQRANRTEEAAELAAHLAVTALHYGNALEARKLADLLQTLTARTTSAGVEPTAPQRHARLVRAAVQFTHHPLGASEEFREALAEETLAEPGYRPVLVLLLAENLHAAGHHDLAELDGLIGSAIAQAQDRPIAGFEDDAIIRLRLVQAEYNADTRHELLRAARRHLIPDRHTAFAHAREARRCHLQSRAEEALECWRDAIYTAIHAGLSDAAADWLYAVRAVNVQYGPWTSELNEEHHLAQALRATGTGHLLDRTRDPREQAMSAIAGRRPIEAVLAARRWLTDSVVTGSWADEREALEFLADLYADSKEPALAATYYQRAGETKKLKALADTVGDLLLPFGPLKDAPWWVLRARAVLISAQADLLEDEAASALLDEFVELAALARRGELVDSPNRALARQAVESVCDLASRGTAAQAIAVLDLLAPDVPREPNHYQHSDDHHAAACLAIARAHPELAMRAMTRLFDLADYGVQEALELIASDDVLAYLGTQRHPGRRSTSPTSTNPLTENEQSALRARAIQLAEDGRYLADTVRARIEPDHPGFRRRAEQARDRILNRPAPVPEQAAIGTTMVSDSYLTSSLNIEDQRACLQKLVAIADDPMELATNRKDALTAARNVVIDQPDQIKQDTFAFSTPFALGEKARSHLDEYAGETHPLSPFKINMGSASLRGQGLQLAAASATTPEQQRWVRDQAVHMLSSDDISDVHAAAVTLSHLPREITHDVDANLLSTHTHVGVRQLSALLCLHQAEYYRDTAIRLANDPDHRVRRTLAAATARAAGEPTESTNAVLEILAHDHRHSVRTAAKRTEG